MVVALPVELPLPCELPTQPAKIYRDSMLTLDKWKKNY